MTCNDNFAIPELQNFSVMSPLYVYTIPNIYCYIWCPGKIFRLPFAFAIKSDGYFYHSCPFVSKICSCILIKNSPSSATMRCFHYSDVIMSAMASQITSLTIVYSTVYSGADKKKPSKLRLTGLCEGNSPVTLCQSNLHKEVRQLWHTAHCKTLQWRHNEGDGVSNHQPHDCLLNRLFRRRSKKTSKLLVTGLCEGNSPVTIFSDTTTSNVIGQHLRPNTHNQICSNITLKPKSATKPVMFTISNKFCHT